MDWPIIHKPPPRGRSASNLGDYGNAVRNFSWDIDVPEADYPKFLSINKATGYLAAKLNA